MSHSAARASKGPGNLWSLAGAAGPSGASRNPRERGFAGGGQLPKPVGIAPAPPGSRFRSLGQQFRHVRTSVSRGPAHLGPGTPAAQPTGADRAYQPGPPAPTGRTSGASRQAQTRPGPLDSAGLCTCAGKNGDRRLTPKAQRK
eukprot:gene19666-biopygen19062